MKISKITGIIPYTDKKINIPLNGQTLILTGKNGSGKTKLLEAIDKVLSSLTERLQNKKNIELAIAQHEDAANTGRKNLRAVKNNIEQIEENLSKLKNNRHLINLQRQIAAGDSQQQQIGQHEKQIAEKNEALNKVFLNEKIDDNRITIATEIQFDETKDTAPSVTLYFEALRSSSFQPVDNIRSMEQEKSNIISQINKSKNRLNKVHAGGFIEKFLANWEVKCALKERRKDFSDTEKLKSWKVKLVESLKILLDDDSTNIKFNEETLSYTIHQGGKLGFTFRDLSSGYSAILRVFSELLMQTEMSAHSPEKIDGFVIIDEIDAHLHPSLQRKVLPFFTELFSNIQFIVSTHSPFVITSTEKTVIYDLSQNQVLDTQTIDLRYFTTDLVSESLLNVSTRSEWLMEKLEKLTNSNNTEEIRNIIEEIGAASEILDNEAMSYLYQAKLRLSKLGKRNEDV